MKKTKLVLGCLVVAGIAGFTWKSATTSQLASSPAQTKLPEDLRSTPRTVNHPKASSHRTVAAQPSELPLQAEEREKLLKDLDTLFRTKVHGIRGPERELAAQGIAGFGNRALTTAAQALREDNRDESEQSIDRRLALQRFLGNAAESSKLAREHLFQYAESPLPSLGEKSERLLHMDLVDRLEAFEHVAKLDAQRATLFISCSFLT